MVIHNPDGGLQLFVTVNQRDIKWSTLIGWATGDGQYQSYQPGRIYHQGTLEWRLTEDTRADQYITLGKKAMVNAAPVWKGMLVGKTMLNTILEWIGTPYNMTLVDSTPPNARGTSQDCLKDSYLGYMKLTTSHRAVSTCDYW